MDANREFPLLVSLYKMSLAAKIAMILCIPFIGHNGFGQDIPWRFKITGTNHTVFLDSKLVIEIEDYSGSGVLGVFYDSLGIDVCAGYVELNASNDYVVAYGETESRNGVTAGERLKFKIWDRGKDCIYDNVGVEYKQTVEAPNTGIFVSDGISKIVSVKAKAIIVKYPVEVICPGDDFISPVRIDPGGYSFEFSSNSGLNIAKNTGVIDAAGSQPGDYKIKILGKYCISNPEVSIRVSTQKVPDISEQQYKCPGVLLDVNSLVAEDADKWMVADSLNHIFAMDTGVYAIKLSNPDGCIIEEKVEVINFPEQEVLYETVYNCESTTIRLADEQELTGLQWSNRATGKSIEVYENSIVGLSYADSNQCSRTKSIDVLVKKLEIQSLRTKAIHADCYFKGRIEIDNATIENNIGILRYEFVNGLTHEIFNSSDQLPEGNYKINVLDERNCVATWGKDLVVLKDCLNDRPVFSPNSDNIDDRYFIPETGKAQVFNRNGIKVAEFETPAYWDGTDSKGEELPMGVYLIVINDKKVINITILK